MELSIAVPLGTRLSGRALVLISLFTHTTHAIPSLLSLYGWHAAIWDGTGQLGLAFSQAIKSMDAPFMFFFSLNDASNRVSRELCWDRWV